MLSDERWNRPDGRGVTAAEADGGLRPLPFCQRRFEADMRRLGAADQARCARSHPEFFDRVDRGFSQPRVIGQAKIIVRRKIDQLLPNDLDFRPLRAADLAKFPEQRLGAEGLQLILKEIAHRTAALGGYIQSPHESSAEASCQTPVLLSPSTTTIISRPGRAPLAIKQ